MIELFFLSILLGFLAAVAVIVYRETIIFHALFLAWLEKILYKIPSIPTLFQIHDWFKIRKYKREQLPDLILQTRGAWGMGKGNKSTEAIAMRLKHAKNVNRKDRGKYL